MKNYILSIPLVSFASSSMTASYQAMDADGLPNACESISLVNDSSQDITVSFDGSTNHNYIVAASTYTLESPQSLINAIRKGTKIYVKGTAGTGNIYLSGKYIA